MKKILLTLLIFPIYCTVNTNLRHPNSHPHCEDAVLEIYRITNYGSISTSTKIKTVKASCTKSMIEQELECYCQMPGIECKWVWDM